MNTTKNSITGDFPDNFNKIVLIISGIIIIFGLYRAVELSWVCDDMYITFRYVDNFLQGSGIVYNAGERVEGYTHFLWFVILSFFRLFGLDLSAISVFLGILSYIGIIIVYFLITRKIELKKIPLLPFTALALSLNYDFSVWATSGLETSFYTLLLSLTFYVYFFTEINNTKKLVFSGMLMALACMTRPDAVIFIIYANALLIINKIIFKESFNQFLKKASYFNLSYIILILPYVIWKINYYGDIFPNTYYVKSAGDSYLKQGFYYMWIFLDSYKTTLISFAVIPIFIKLLFQNGTFQQKIQNITGNISLLTAIIAFCAALSYLFLFTARVGGDFMFARFIIPILPFLYFTIEQSLKYFLKNSKKLSVIIFTGILIMIYFEKGFRDELFIKNENGKISRVNSTETGGVTDERFYYYSYWEQFPKSKNLAEALIITGKNLNPYFKDLDITVAIGGARNYIGYYAEFKNIIIDNGLTDKFIARLPITERGRIGHEKHAPLEYLVKRKAVLGLYETFRHDTKQKPYAVSYIRIKDLGIKFAVEIIYYDKETLNTLKKRMGDNFIFTDMESFVNNYISTVMRTRSVDEVKNDYKNLKEFYFDFNNDPGENVILGYIGN